MKRVSHMLSGQSVEDMVSPVTILPDTAHPSIHKLQAGNLRYLSDKPLNDKDDKDVRRKLSSLGQNPWAILVSCADSRVPVERLFDAGPGDLFVIRVAGNIAGSPVGGVIGSAEYGVEHLKSPVIMVLGHTKCGAVSAAVKCCKEGVGTADFLGRNLGATVGNIRAPALQALEDCERPETPLQIEEAIKLNVFHSMEKLMQWSTVIQEAMQAGKVQLHGGIYDITTGQVSFLGRHPREEQVLAKSGVIAVRTGLDAPMPSVDALNTIKAGNQRYILGDVETKVVDAKMRNALVQQGQRPLAVVLGCADSRIPIEYVFDTKPGDLFVVRNAGSTCGAMGGGLIGSIEYGVGNLKSQLLVVLGHTKCGAVQAAMDAHLAQKADGTGPPEGIKALLSRLEAPVKKAVEECKSTATDQRVELAIELNVWHTIEQMLQQSPVLMQAVCRGTLQVHGAIYDLATGRVRFMGEHPKYALIADEIDGPKTAWTTDTKPKQAGVKPMSVVPCGNANDMERGTTAWGEDPKKEEKDKGFTCEFSWIVKTKNGNEHLRDVVLDMNNWRAGVTVAFVSVPLSIALGIASGTTPMRGVATAVFGGLCSGLFGSSDYNIVGPAGALSGMLASYVVSWDEACLPYISLMSAAICAVCAILRLDVYMLMMPKSVFEGFTVGVALIIGLSQINFACGIEDVDKKKLFILNIIESFKNLDQIKAPSLVVFLIQAPVLWFLMRKIPKIPWTVILPLVSIPLGVICSEVDVGFELLTLKTKYGILKPELVVPLEETKASFGELIIPSFSVAIVAVLETLISAKIAATRVDRSFNELQEMGALVLGHAVCGMAGAMAPTGVFVRTNLNTTLGATHRFSQFLNAVVVAIIALACMPVFSYLPQATIAAILVVAAVRMTPMSYLKQLWAQDRVAFTLCIVTALVCVGEDPVIGLAAGMLVALLMSAKNLMRSRFVDIKVKGGGVGGKKSYMVSLNGALTYINGEVFLSQARKLENAGDVTLNLEGLRQVDHDALCFIGKVLEEWTKNKTETKVRIKAVNPVVYTSLEKHSWFHRVEDDGGVLK